MGPCHEGHFMVPQRMNNPAAYFDSHMHTPLCKHAFGEPEEYAERALQRGLAGIIFTCHSPMPRRFWPSVRMEEAEFDDYVALIERCRRRYEGRLEVRLGMETDYFPGFEKWVEALHQRASFHYCLGSVHYQGPEYHDKFGGSPTDFRRSYWQNLAASAETGLFDCLAHPDLIKNYQPATWDFSAWEADIAAALDRIARTGVCMELNTSGMNKSYPEMNPGPAMLGMMRERGIPVVIGSDSHRAGRVADNFVRALASLQEAGYTEVQVFQNRKRSALAIADVLPQMIAGSQQADELAMLARAAA
jgi:histidinol-phosphatase (PHP family)